MIHKFDIMWSHARSIDGAQFAFPPGTPPGRYTAYYRWAGYRDAVNIDVVPDDVRIPDTQRGRYGYFPRGAWVGWRVARYGAPVGARLCAWALALLPLSNKTCAVR